MVKLTMVRSNIDTHIVFVHGTFGDSDTTWINTNTNPNFDLPAVIDADMQNAKVWKFGYEIPKSDYTTKSHFLTRMSKKLINEIKKRKTMEEGRIIFVAHSLGGLIVKEAIVQLSLYQPPSSFCNLFNQVKGVAFLATPHNGSSLVEELDEEFQVSKKIKGAQKEIFELLFPGNHRLMKLKEDFKFICENSIEKIDFKETKETNLKKYKKEIENITDIEFKIGAFKNIVATISGAYNEIIVDKESSYAGFGEKPIRISDNHVYICKPKNKRYKIYKRIKKFINEECW